MNGRYIRNWQVAQEWLYIPLRRRQTRLTDITLIRRTISTRQCPAEGSPISPPPSANRPARRIQPCLSYNVRALSLNIIIVTIRHSQRIILPTWYEIVCGVELRCIQLQCTPIYERGTIGPELELIVKVTPKLRFLVFYKRSSEHKQPE